jgi:hypothetical protein
VAVTQEPADERAWNMDQRKQRHQNPCSDGIVAERLRQVEGEEQD